MLDWRNKGEKEPKEILVVSNPSHISFFLHPQKEMIMKSLYYEAKTIIQISEQSKLNPGTIKRHLDELLSAGLIIVAKEEVSQKKILMKFYRISALHFEIKFSWPPN